MSTPPSLSSTPATPSPTFSSQEESRNPPPPATAAVVNPPASSPSSSNPSPTLQQQQQKQAAAAKPTQQSQQQQPQKIRLHLKAVGSAPILKQKNWDVEPSRSVAALQQLLRRLLNLPPAESLFLFVNQSFAPSPDHTLGTLQQCFGSGGVGEGTGVDGSGGSGNSYKLTLHYSTTQAWG